MYRYPLATLWYEADLARRRVNARMATETVLMNAVVIAALAPKGKGAAPLKKLLKDLSDG